MHEYGFFQPPFLPGDGERGTPDFYVCFLVKNAECFIDFLGFTCGIFLKNSPLPNDNYPAFSYSISKEPTLVFNPTTKMVERVTSGFFIFRFGIDRDVGMERVTHEELLRLLWSNFFAQFRKYLFENKILQREDRIKQTSCMRPFFDECLGPCHLLAFVNSPEHHPNKPTEDEIDFAIVASLCLAVIFSHCDWDVKCKLIKEVLFYRQEMFAVDDGFMLDSFSQQLFESETEPNEVSVC